MEEVTLEQIWGEEGSRHREGSKEQSGGPCSWNRARGSEGRGVAGTEPERCYCTSPGERRWWPGQAVAMGVAWRHMLGFQA